MAAAVRSVAVSLMERGGLIRKIENLGTRELPYRMKTHAQIFTTGITVCVYLCEGGEAGYIGAVRGCPHVDMCWLISLA